MEFWKMIFVPAMTVFKTMPNVTNPERNQQYDIREAEKWETVYEKLVAARDHYVDKTGVRGHLQQTWRWLADNVIEVVSVAVAVSPKPDIATPVFAAVNIIIEAVKTGAERRKEVLQGLEGLEDIFSDVELFLATFEGEQDITNKAIVLIAHVLVAVERGIGFFTKHSYAQVVTLERRNAELEMQNTMLRSVSPAVQQSAWAPPPCLFSTDQQTLWEQLDIDDLDTADMDHIESRGPFLSSSDRSQTEQLEMHHTFQDWVVAAHSTKLLVHGNLVHSPMHTSALSLFCSTIVQAFRYRKHFLCIVWFCGLHQGGGKLSDWNDNSSNDSHMSDWGADSDFCSDSDDNEDFGCLTQYGPGTRTQTLIKMMRSLIAQLLCDYQFEVGIDLLPPGLAPEQIHGASLDQLRALFAWLVRMLPADITLFCVIDGISFYERDEYEEPLLELLGDILGLTAEKDLNAVLKVLVTSPWPTAVVRMGFEEEEGEGKKDGGETESLILPLDTISGAQVSYKLERLRRELDGVTEDGVEKKAMF
ncbi:hypothetical protein CMQ_4801 [Grosmannia clavigera kw1407]|uniref:Uncharacterized protein n=1 Tax=Grosmannia clavigera (strain kw1407 / UAMH 11150) TaxID=655863 RepID=F0XUD7_GROCL|nr:uncharacterized protein CMQ_4801 [Grosmannia clavigera kw1407]EFW98949.1 hypothetical protein CMQ_4801 [Grosmannia clavigera kw1407]